MHTRTLRRLSNTRDLRAEILSLAAQLVTATGAKGRMLVVDPVINAATVRNEWAGLLPAIAPGVRTRMSLAIEGSEASTVQASRGSENASLPLDKPNYRFEVLRLLLGARLERTLANPAQGIAAQVAGSQIGLMRALGASPTPIRSALAALRDAGLIHSLRRLEIAPETLSMEQLGLLGALPQTLRFRFERGARIKPPADLLARAEPLLGPNGLISWQPFSLSGTPVGQSDAPGLDLIGMPRLDLVAHAPRGDKGFDANLMRMLDDGLEPEPNILAPAPVLVTVVRAATRFEWAGGLGQARRAHPCDVFLSLLDIGLREQALQYARAMRS